MKYNSKLSRYQIKKIIKCFCIDIDATKTALLLDINRNTINRWYNIFRQEIYQYQVNQKNQLYGSVEVDESYFGAKRQRGYHGKNQFVHGHCHINGIDSFWSFTKRRLAKFNGVAANFELHLKECDWRWNQDINDLQRQLSALVN